MNTFKTIPLTQGRVVKVDSEDYNYLSKNKWLYDSGYAKRHKKRPEKGWIIMHRVIMNAPNNLHCDHINGDKLDNRKSNLRLCSNAQNMMNRPKQVNNKSGFRGVSWHKQRRKWRAYIKSNGKQIALGLYDSPEEASKAYQEVAKDLFGEFYHA